MGIEVIWFVLMRTPTINLSAQIVCNKKTRDTIYAIEEFSIIKVLM